jgi:hypothetical protein
MINDNEVGFVTDNAPRPVTRNVEEVFIEALENVTLDATRMEGVEEFWSDFSRGDMTFTGVNLRGSNLNITKDVTFGIKDTMHDTDFNGLFDSLSLTREAASQSNSQLLVRIADVSTETPEAPLTNVNLNLSFDLGEDTITLENVRSTDGSYAGLVTAINNALALEGYANLTVELSTPYTDVTFAGNTVNLPFTAQEILITDPAGNEFDNINFTQSAIQPVVGGFLVAGNASAVPPGASSNLIESNLVLDNAGNGSTAGDVLIGGMSNSNLGVERFNVLVDRDSKIASLNTNNNALQEIHISSLEAEGDLWIGATQADLNEIDANAFAGQNLSLGEGTAISDLTFLDASGTSANITFVADYDGNGRASNEQAFVINTGSGNDTITAELTGTSTSGSTQANLTISSTGGNNTVTLSSTNVEVNTAMVTLGAGADTVTGGDVDVTVVAGAGNDTVYAENTGAKALANLVFAGLTTATPATDIASHTNGNIHFLAGKQLQVTIAVGDTGTGTAVSNVTGFESAAVTIEASQGTLTTQADVNNAILKAINEDAVLSKLAVASISSNGQLVVEYLVDGIQVANAIDVNISNPTTALVASAAMQREYRDLVNNSSLTTAAIQALYDDNTTGTGVAGGLDVANSNFAHTGSTIQVTTAGTAGDVFTITVGDKEFTVVSDGGGVIADSVAIAAELAQNGYYAVSDGTNTAAVVTLEEISVETTGSAVTTETPAVALSEVTFPALAGTGSVSTVNTNEVNGGAGDDVIVLSSDSTLADTVVYTGYNQGNDTIVHFENGVDELDFTAYLTGTVPSFGSGSTSAESEVALANTAVASEAFTANSINLVNFTALDAMAPGVTFDNMTVAQLTAALNADASNSITATTDLYQNTAKSVLVIQDNAAGANAGVYAAYELTYANTAVVAGTAKDFSVQLIGTFDLGEAVLATGDFLL